MADEDDPKHCDDPPEIEAGRPPRGQRLARVFRLVATLAIVGCAAVAAILVWQYYVIAPWTRDGRVRVQVANIAPQVSGQIIEVRVSDNQPVKKGDVLYVIEPFDFQVAIASAEAEIRNREADLQVKNAQSARREALSTVSTSIEEKQQFAGTAKIAEAALETAKAQLAQAKANLDRTQVRSTVNGRVTNLLMRVGDYASTGTANIRVIDTESFWIDGYFEETKIAAIRVGDTAEMALMGYADSLRGRVESITLGIATSNATAGTQGLPSVDPVYTWVRLAQRVPVRLRIEHIPPGVELVAGMTATVVVGNGVAPLPGWLPAWLAGWRSERMQDEHAAPAPSPAPATPAAPPPPAPAEGAHPHHGKR